MEKYLQKWILNNLNEACCDIQDTECFFQMLETWKSVILEHLQKTNHVYLLNNHLTLYWGKISNRHIGLKKKFINAFKLYLIP